MIQTNGYAASKIGAPLKPFQFERREPGENDVWLEILYCGICHSDLHQVRDEWGGSIFPMVPGHEIVGRVRQVGRAVSRFKVGDIGGVGCFVDSCRECANCRAGLQQYCERGMNATYNSHDRDGKPTYGGYSQHIIVDEAYVLRVPAGLPLERVAPLLCAGITTYSPLRHWKVGAKQRVGILGLGGLGHMAVKLAAAMGADVTVLSSSKAKAADAQKLGAQHFVLTSEPKAMHAMNGHFDFLLDTVSAPHDVNLYLALLRTAGAMVLLGVPPKPPTVDSFNLIGQRRTLAGSMIGGIPETQEMLDYCAAKNALADVEVIPAKDINQAYERMLIGDVRYRFVIDAHTFDL
jgi:uncharacterized zinc-type alcohol dehydrogenase-like protein